MCADCHAIVAGRHVQITDGRIADVEHAAILDRLTDEDRAVLEDLDAEVEDVDPAVRYFDCLEDQAYEADRDRD